MSFREIEYLIKPTYNSANEDLVNDFYNVVLSKSKRYDRISGFFNSTSLAMAAKGIGNFIENKGHMRLLCGSKLSEEDLNSILNFNDLKDIIDENFLKDLSDIEDKIIEDHVKVLGWMVANNYLEIKIGINKKNGKYYNNGMLHSKIGILYDDMDDSIMFDGSVNETAYGWKVNIESLKVFLGWIDEKYMVEDINNFNEFWNGENESLEVFDIPTAAKEKLIEIAPKNEVELNKLILKINNKSSDERELFKHQEEAISKWFNNGKIGIFEMATGTGKTFTALKCLENILKEEDVLTVIACPYAHLVEQWFHDVERLDLGIPHRFYGTGNYKWRSEFDSLIFDINLGIDSLKSNIILTTHNTFSDEDFINKIKSCNKKLFLIVDEMHHVGAKKYSEGLLPEYEYRLGLSATPSRYMDYEGTDVLMSYFDKTVFKFSIIQALNSINPKTGKSFLTPYDYYPYRVDFTKDEFKEYKQLTKEIGRKMAMMEDNEPNESLQGLIAKRRLKVNCAINKYDVLSEILRKIEKKDHLIVFCSQEQVKKVLNILNEEGFYPKHKFTQDEDPRPSLKYDGLSQREVLLDLFDKGEYKALVAIKCLDEGVDVPSADKVIIMASTTNPIEYVQRRGRVLRRFPNKEKACIYDISVFPEDDDPMFKSLVKSETKRLQDFIKTADNKKYGINLLKKWGVYE